MAIKYIARLGVMRMLTSTYIIHNYIGIARPKGSIQVVTLHDKVVELPWQQEAASLP